MPNIDRHLPGSFNWFELATTDQTAAKSFYQALFNWNSVDSPMGPDEFYTTFKVEDRKVAAAYALRPESAPGIPSHWNLYIAVASADETAAKIQSSGGKLMAAPFDVMSLGRMAAASDPTGAAFCIWEAKTHIGTTITGVDGSVCWADLTTPDPKTAAEFYESVFGWQPIADQDSGYLRIKNGERFIGGIPPANPSAPPSWLLTFQTSDVEVSTNRAGALGANTVFPVTELPGAGKFSILQDPQGAAFSLFQPA